MLISDWHISCSTRILSGFCYLYKYAVLYCNYSLLELLIHAFIQFCSNTESVNTERPDFYSLPEAHHQGKANQTQGLVGDISHSNHSTHSQYIYLFSFYSGTSWFTWSQRWPWLQRRKGKSKKKVSLGFYNSNNRCDNILKGT